MNVDDNRNGRAQAQAPAPSRGTEENSQERFVPSANGGEPTGVTNASDGDKAITSKADTLANTNGGDKGAKLTSTAGAYAPGGNSEIQKAPMLNEKDPTGSKITSIFWTTRHFAIYEADNQIRSILPDDYDIAKNLRHKVADLGGLRASIEDLRAEPSISSLERTRAGREVAWALTLAFEDESNPPSGQPKDILTRVDTRLRSLVKSHYRKKYVLANVVAFFAIEIALMLVAIIFSQVFVHHGNLGALHRYAVFGAFGGLGAFLSVTTGVSAIDVDINLKRWEHIFAGASRILIGVVGALVIGLALDSRFIDPPSVILVGPCSKRFCQW
jgi:hypothetical protein